MYTVYNITYTYVIFFTSVYIGKLSCLSSNRIYYKICILHVCNYMKITKMLSPSLYLES